MQDAGMPVFGNGLEAQFADGLAMKKVVSFSLWGAQPKYTAGAVKNAALCRRIYPGWVARFYVGTSVPVQTLEQLVELGAEIVHKAGPGDWTGLVWRFEAASDPDVEVMLSRDCDSRLNEREAAAVGQWMTSKCRFHIMRDHPFHDMPILGGMWGVKAPLLRDMCALLDAYCKADYWQTDQEFLRDVIYHRVKRRAMVHDEFFAGIPFPCARRGREFVGQIFDESDETSDYDLERMEQALRPGLAARIGRRFRLAFGLSF